MSTCEAVCLASIPPVISADHPPTTLQANASTDLTVQRGGMLRLPVGHYSQDGYAMYKEKSWMAQTQARA